MNRTELPAPIYAAAGAGDVAYQQLRRLPEVAHRLRESAQRGSATFVARAATVQDRTAAGYRRLVARGEQVMAERIGVATGHPEPTGIEVEVGQVQPAQPAERPETSTT